MHRTMKIYILANSLFGDFSVNKNRVSRSYYKTPTKACRVGEKQKQRIMKKILLILSLMVPMLVTGATSGNRASKNRIGSFIADCRHYEGAEVVHLGTFATSLGKGILKIASIDDPDARELIKMIKGVKSLYVLSYDDCSNDVKAKVNSRLEKMLEGFEMLLEAKDGEDKVKIYGVVSENGKKVSDFILHTPSECAVICILGAISTEAIAKLALND